MKYPTDVSKGTTYNVVVVKDSIKMSSAGTHDFYSRFLNMSLEHVALKREVAK